MDFEIWGELCLKKTFCWREALLLSRFLHLLLFFLKKQCSVHFHLLPCGTNKSGGSSSALFHAHQTWEFSHPDAWCCPGPQKTWEMVCLSDESTLDRPQPAGTLGRLLWKGLWYLLKQSAMGGADISHASDVCSGWGARGRQETGWGGRGIPERKFLKSLISTDF